MSYTNQYVVVSADSGARDAEDVRKLISHHLSTACSGSTCYTYKNIRCAYDAFADEETQIAQFLSSFDCKIGFQNIFWLFLLTPNIQYQNHSATNCDQQLWLRVGKVIGQLLSKTSTYKNQISFWRRNETTASQSGWIFGEKIREFQSGLEAIYSYVDSAERRTKQLNTIFVSKCCQQQNIEIIRISPAEKIVLLDDCSNTVDILEPLVNVHEKPHFSAGKIIKMPPGLLEITIQEIDQNGGS